MKAALVLAIACAYGVLLARWTTAPLRGHGHAGTPTFGGVLAAYALFLAALGLAVVVLLV